ncbi:MAG: hypothetical protein A2096_06475 [Spirochaetes bacterium GWF1_41_5]|nr:MAG: hypothetical protein A2096_06475 [Spirochaetes bacterium GWF1_41_5]HBE01234.1 hypothetical protein [Spirochaetia bacterium]
MNSDFSDEVNLIIRADDFGMSHACNAAVKKCFDSGILGCSSIQAPAPWAYEAALMARSNPSWCIGVHITLVGEWQGFRWRPVMPYDKVPSLVDENGFLFQSPAEFLAAEPDPDELELEITSQVELLALRWKIKIDYLDYHHLDLVAPSENAALKASSRIIKKLAGKYNIPISGYFNEKKIQFFGIRADEKEKFLIKQLESLKPGLWLLVCHLLCPSIDSDALVHEKKEYAPPDGTARQRTAEKDVLLGSSIRNIISEKNIKLLNYRQM